MTLRNPVVSRFFCLNSEQFFKSRTIRCCWMDVSSTCHNRIVLMIAIFSGGGNISTDLRRNYEDKEHTSPQLTSPPHLFTSLYPRRSTTFQSPTAGHSSSPFPPQPLSLSGQRACTTRGAHHQGLSDRPIRNSFSDSKVPPPHWTPATSLWWVADSPRPSRIDRGTRKLRNSWRPYVVQLNPSPWVLPQLW